MEIGMRENGKHLQKHLAFSRNKFLSLFIHPSTYTTANRPPTDVEFSAMNVLDDKKVEKVGGNFLHLSCVYSGHCDVFSTFSIQQSTISFFAGPKYINIYIPICVFYIKKHKNCTFFSLFHHHLRSLGKKIHYVLQRMRVFKRDKNSVDSREMLFGLIDRWRVT